MLGAVPRVAMLHLLVHLLLAPGLPHEHHQVHQQESLDCHPEEEQHQEEDLQPVDHLRVDVWPVVANGVDVVDQDPDSSELEHADNQKDHIHNDDTEEVINVKIFNWCVKEEMDYGETVDNVENISEDANITEDYVFFRAIGKGEDVCDIGLEDDEEVEEDIDKDSILAANYDDLNKVDQSLIESWILEER